MVFTLNTNEEFIQKLQRERTDYKHASQVRMQAKSIMQLSVGIYTDPERFVYELLQNSVDAFTDTQGDTLNILIKSEDDRIIFMHNGKGFDKKDVESVCDVGNGTKSSDSKKIGYKGIGFKSVFMPSVDRVSIISDQFCFEFDKNKAFSLMPSFPPKEGELKPDDIPWQVIPIYSPQLKELSDPAFNVITVVHTKESGKIANQIENLFSDLQFLLFLRSNNVNIRYEHNGRTIFSFGKKQTESLSNDISKVTLFKNNEPQSCWILYTDTVAVPEKIKEELEHDFNTPDKLKQAQNVEISFAIQVKDNKVIPLDGNSIFTFLPTSYRCLRQPFLINSNFITDAGRQQLLQQSEWNKLIFRNIPGIYLKFISLISRRYSNYCEVLPNLSPDYDSLTKQYSIELIKALNSIEFVPNYKGNRLLKLEEVLVDKTGFSESGVIFSKLLLQHLNSRSGTSLSEDNYVDDAGIADYAEDYIILFDTEELVRFVADRTVLSSLSLQESIALIRFIYKYFSKADTRFARYQEELGNISFLLDKKGEFRRPNELFFPSEYQEQNKETADIVILNVDFYKNIREDTGVIEWLSSLGIRKLSNISFLNYLLENPNYITAEKAISLGRFIFRELNKFDYTKNETFIKNRENLLFLAKDGNLRPICNLYLGTKYKPDDDLESVYPKLEIYISDDYIEGNNADDWSYFLKKCGVRYKIEVCPHDYASADLNFEFLKKAAESFTYVKHSMSNYSGYRNLVENIHFRLYYFICIDFSIPQYSLDKFIFSRVLSSDRSVWNKKDLVYGRIHYWNSPIYRNLLNYSPNTFKSQYNSYLEYLLAEKQLFPTTRGTSEKPTNIFINTTKNQELGGKYLPVLAIDSKVHESWIDLIHFKQTLMLEDLLQILERISLDDELNPSERKTKISRIYTEIIERDEQNSAVIREWAQTHRILAESGEFLPPSSLTYNLVDGFKNNDHKAYCGKTSQSILELLKTFGVRVITQKDVTPDFNNSVEKDELKNLIFNKLKYISVLKSGDSSDIADITNRMQNKVQETHFYKCDSIALSYGERKDTISKSTYYNGDCFYYTGKITPALMDPLITYLCSLLKISASESSKLMVIFLTDNHQSVKDFLEDCGYDVSMFNSAEFHAADVSEDGDLIDAEDNSDDNTVADDDIFSTIGKGEDSPLSNSAMYDAQIEAQRYLMQEEPEWSFPLKYGMCDENGQPYHYSTVEVTDEKGNNISIVLKSHKKKDSPFKINAAEWEYLVKRSAYLLIYTGNDIRKITKEDLIKNQSRISLSFSTENLDTNDCIEKFCSALHYFKELHFDFDSFNITQNAESIRSIFNRNSGSQEANTLMDI